MSYYHSWLARLICHIFGHNMIDCGSERERVQMCSRCRAFWRESMNPGWRRGR
jgi:hypothetical protein